MQIAYVMLPSELSLINEIIVEYLLIPLRDLWSIVDRLDDDVVEATDEFSDFLSVIFARIVEVFFVVKSVILFRFYFDFMTCPRYIHIYVFSFFMI